MFTRAAAILSVCLVAFYAYAQSICAVVVGDGNLNFAALSNFTNSSLPIYRAARNATNAGSGNTRVCFVGDSTTGGAGAGGANGVTNGVASSFPTQLAALVPHASWSSFFADHNSFGSNSVALSTFDARINEGSYNVITGSDPTTAGGYLLFDSAGSTQFTFTPTNNVDTFLFFYPINTTFGATNVSINGGSPTTVSQVGSASNGQQTFSATLGSNTIDLVRSSGTSYINGVIAYNSAQAEVSLINLGGDGWTINDWSTAASPWSPFNYFSTLACKLTIIDVTINDWNAGTSLATFQTQTQALITAAVNAGSDVMLMTGVPSSTSLSSNAQQQTYVSVYKTLSTSNSIPLLDWTKVWVDWNTANANGWMFDTRHPNATGYGFQAEIIAQILNH